METLYSKVAGVTFEGRQSVIAEMIGNEQVMLKPEPENKFDPNAIAVWVAFPPEAQRESAQIGYLPKEIAAKVAPNIEGESMYGQVDEITGGFEIEPNRFASYGVIVRVELPSSKDMML